MKRARNCEKIELLIEKSRFIAENFSVKDPSEVKERLKEQKIRYADATHVCHAFFCGPNRETAGCSDDREPSGTAGRPMLEVLKGNGITDILVTVVRYFGGTKLGTGGLVRAYSGAVKELLARLETEEAVDKEIIGMEMSYGDYEKVRQFAEKQKAALLSEQFAETVLMTVEVASAEADRFRSSVSEMTAARIRFSGD